MTSRRTSPDTYMVRVHSKVIGVNAEPAHRRFTVMDVSGEEVLW